LGYDATNKVVFLIANDLLQKNSPFMREQYHKWYSNRINKEFEMLTFGYAGVPLVLFPTSMGSYYQYKDFGMIDQLLGFIRNGKIKVYCPDSYDKESWYNTNIDNSQKIQNHLLYDDFILNEVIYKAMDETKHTKVITAGCSLGGYHAVNLAFRHPDKVSHTFSLSGAFDLRILIADYFDTNYYLNSPVDYMPNLNNEWYLKHINQMGIVLACGEYDQCRSYNYQLANILQLKNIGHWLDVKHGARHDWSFWNEALPKYLTAVNK
jgi:esterase/lipase superfamily enzyme